MSFEEFQDGRHGSHLGYRNRTILAILNLHVAKVPPIKFQLNPNLWFWRRCRKCEKLTTDDGWMVDNRPWHKLTWSKAPGELEIENTSNDISSVTSGWISIKHTRIVPWEVLYKNCFYHSALLHKMAVRVKIEKKKTTSNDIFSVTTRRISTKLDWIVPWEVLYQNCSNQSAPLHKMAARAKNRKKLQTTSPP